MNLKLIYTEKLMFRDYLLVASIQCKELQPAFTVSELFELNLNEYMKVSIQFICF